MSPIVELKHWSNSRKKQGQCTFGCARTLWAGLKVRLEGRDLTWLGTSTRATLEEACPGRPCSSGATATRPSEDWNEAPLDFPCSDEAKQATLLACRSRSGWKRWEKSSDECNWTSNRRWPGWKGEILV